MSEMFNGVEAGFEPFDRLTKLCAVMTDALDTALELEAVETGEEIQPVRVIILMDSDDKAGAEMLGYENATEGTVALLQHLKALLNAQGKKMGLMSENGVMLMDES